MSNVCFSGGAVGSDTAFYLAARAAGHKVVQYHFDERNSGKPGFHILSDRQLEAARSFLKKANETLGRTVPKDGYVYNLLARNWYQVRDSNRVFAVGRISDGNILGGTAWAVQMFIDSNLSPSVFFFDQYAETWFQWENSGWMETKSVPRPGGYYTGIGTRDLNEAGEEAIRALYRRS